MKREEKKGLKLKWNSCVVQLIQIESISFDIGNSEGGRENSVETEVYCNGKWPSLGRL